MTTRLLTLLAAIAVSAVSLVAAPAPAPDITGKWTTAFETQVGTMNLTFDFTVKEGKVTGTIVGKNDQIGDLKSEIKNGKVDAEAVSFTEDLDIMGMTISIAYKGKIVSADEIKFARTVGEFATEEFVAKRVKA
jgi:hypothetical protein